jgi:hypothetical protein
MLSKRFTELPVTFLHHSIPPATEDFILKLQETGNSCVFITWCSIAQSKRFRHFKTLAHGQPGGAVSVEALNAERRTKFKALCLLSPNLFQFSKQMSLDSLGGSFMMHRMRAVKNTQVLSSAHTPKTC